MKLIEMTGSFKLKGEGFFSYEVWLYRFAYKLYNQVLCYSFGSRIAYEAMKIGMVVVVENKVVFKLWIQDVEYNPVSKELVV